MFADATLFRHWRLRRLEAAPSIDSAAWFPPARHLSIPRSRGRWKPCSHDATFRTVCVRPAL